MATIRYEQRAVLLAGIGRRLPLLQLSKLCLAQIKCYHILLEIFLFFSDSGSDCSSVRVQLI